MNKFFFAVLISGTTAALLLSGCATAELEKQNAAFLRESESTKKEIFFLRMENETLKKEKAKLAQELSGSIGIRDLFEFNIDGSQINYALILRYLNLISLPEKPNPVQKREYLNNIYALRNTCINSSNRIHLRITSDISAHFGHGDMELLFPYMDYQPIGKAVTDMARPTDKPLFLRMIDDKNRGNRYIVLNLYRRFADASDKKDILNRLEQNYELIPLVSQLGFEKEALPILKRMMGNNPNYFPQIIQILEKHISREELIAIADRCWNYSVMEYTANRDHYHLFSIAMELLRIGYKPAFIYMAENIEMLPRFDSSWLPRIMVLVPERYQKKSTLQNWVRSNAKNLYYNESKKQFDEKVAQEKVKTPEKKKDSVQSAKTPSEGKKIEKKSVK